ncbi:MAG: diguanylate cyclase [Smithellaceae bacterium]|jgi:diguanylate cyclase (GGDEF)-like protein/PAS domain S-box-containing protein|nr:diguanylate cyclase [Syntrophaceae bacterium]HPV52276.1 diguanylate cyclase [Smithella sp.]
MTMPDRRKAIRRVDDARYAEDLSRRYEFLLRHTTDIIFAVRYSDRRILEASTAALEAYQYSMDEFKSMTLDDLNPDDFRGRITPRSDRVSANVAIFETVHRRKNGQVFPVEISSQGAVFGNDRILLSIVRDLSEDKKFEQCLCEEESNLRALLNAVTESLLLAEVDGTVIAANETFAKRMRVGLDNIIGVNIYKLLPADIASERRKQVEDIIRSGKPARFEGVINKRFIDHVIYPVCDAGGKVARLALFGADITRRREMEKKLEAMALTDQLTDLYNRRGFFTLATREVKRAERSKKGLLLFFADLDGLKDINDRLGHEEGDHALIAAAKILTRTFRVSDIISRIGGDEFAILVIDADEEMMEKLLLRFYRLINNFNVRKAASFKLAISIGYAVYDPLNPTTLDEMIAVADKMMYKMKKVRYRRV